MSYCMTALHAASLFCLFLLLLLLLPPLPSPHSSSLAQYISKTGALSLCHIQLRLWAPLEAHFCREDFV